MDDGYGDDLAYIHDAGFGHTARAAAPCLLGHLRRAGKAGGLVVDLGCGSGPLAAELSAAGYDVLGIDQSEAMVALGRRRAPRAEFRTGSVLSADLPPCVAVSAVGEIFNYLFDPSHSTRRLTALFRRIRDALEPGGLLLFDVAAPGRGAGVGLPRRFFEGDGWAALVEVEEKGRILTRRITSFRKVGELYRRTHEVHRQRLFTRPELADPLRELGFRVRPLGGYGPLRFRRGSIGFLARKP
jgi:SAM-dependent methyltransferase